MLLRTVSKLKCPNFVSPYRRPLSTAITSQLNALVSSLPHKDAISYRTAAEAGIVKWTFSDVDRYAGAFAAGLEEASFTTGDALAAWLPPNSAEKLIAQFAADRVGLVLVEVDPALGDGVALRSVLADSSAKGLLFDAGLAGGAAAAVVGEALPEIAEGGAYDSAHGLPFRSRAVPSMRLVVHTGMELRPGMQNMKYMMTFDPAARPPLAVDGAPLAVAYSADGKKEGPLPAKEALALPSWAAVAAILNKEHVAVE